MCHSLCACPSIILFKAHHTVLIINLEQTSLVIRALCEREYLQPSSVLSLEIDRVQRIEHSSGECVSCERVQHYLRAVTYFLKVTSTPGKNTRQAFIS